MGKRFWIENEFIESYLSKISGNATKVLLAITRHYNKEGTCYPSIRRLSKLTGLHHSTVTKCLKELELLGFLEQLIIKERCRLRYSFSKTARILLPKSSKLLYRPDTKEEYKEDLKEESFLENSYKKTENPRQELVEGLVRWAGSQNNPPSTPEDLMRNTVRKYGYEKVLEAKKRHGDDISNGFSHFWQHLKGKCACFRDN